jgi:hypothetical protein
MYRIAARSLSRIVVILPLLLACESMYAQRGLSILTDLSLLHNFSRDQAFTTIGQTVGVNFHLTPKETVYGQISYYVNGKFSNRLTAQEKDTAGGVQNVGFGITSRLGYRQFSLGWKHYFVHSYDQEEGLNIYGTGGFGVLSGRVENTSDRSVDTALYTVPPRSLAGTGKFTRLTFDVSLGAETALAAGFFWYGEVRTWLHTSRYPSPYLYTNRVPGVLMLNTGVRILFD